MAENAKPKAAVLTLGCKVNQFESSSMAESLAAAGYEVLAQPFGVDLAVLNTCTVTQKADQEALALIRRLRRRNPGAKIVCTGCLAQANPGLLLETGLVDLVLGQTEKGDLVGHLRALAGGPVALRRDVAGPAVDFGTPTPSRTRAFYKIQDGCQAFCAYCAVPLSRGPSRSLGLDTVLDGLRAYMGMGLSEVVLCGIHMGLWGHDLTPPLKLADLIHTIAGEIAPDETSFRLRLSSMEPLEVGDDLVEAYDMYPWLARHFHLPLQSGSDRVLALMGRPYRSGAFRDLVGKLKARWPMAGLGVDVIVGFPGETEGDFQATADLLAGLPLTYFHVFPYSRRPGTRAADMPGQVPEHAKRARAMALKGLGAQKRAAFAAANEGREELAVVENTPHPGSGRLKALTGNYLPALLPPGFQGGGGGLLKVRLSASRNEWGLMEAEPLF